MTRSTLLQIVAVTLSLMAAYVSLKLLAKHVQGSSGVAWFDAGCASDQEGGANCEAVMKSKYGAFPFAKDDDPDNMPRIPVALLGLFYYSGMAVWLIGIGRPTHERRHLHILPLMAVAAGLCASAFFTYVMFTGLDNWCPWCIVTHVLNLLLAVCLLLLWPRGARKTETGVGDAQSADDNDEAQPRLPSGARPTARQILATAMAIMFVLFAEQAEFGHAVANRSLTEYKTALNSFQNDRGKMIHGWSLEPQFKFEKRSDDAIGGKGTEKRHTGLVVFSDFECPSCRKFAKKLEDEIQPLFDGNIDVLFRHYPLNHDCNPHVKTKMHANSCHLLRLAEAARIVGGTDAFWKAHDYLFENQRKDDKLTPEALVMELGIDPAEFARALQDEQIGKRVAEDTAEAKRVGVHSTPTVFVSGRKVVAVYRNSIQFWDALADAYWEGIKKERPARTKLKKNAAPKAGPAAKHNH